MSLDGKKMDSIALVEKLDAIAGAHGFGRVDMVENRLVGIKSREVYEVPGSLSLIMAHRELEDLTLTRELQHFKTSIDQRLTELIYDGLWFSPLAECLRSFIEQEPEAGQRRGAAAVLQGLLPCRGPAFAQLTVRRQAGDLRVGRHLQARGGRRLHPPVGSAAGGMGAQA